MRASRAGVRLAVCAGVCLRCYACQSVEANEENWRWEYEDGLPGSGEWRPVDDTMGREL